MASRFKTAVLGGTFDHLHLGHKKLIEYGLSLSDKLVVGMTSDKYVKKLKTYNGKITVFESFETRKKSLENYLLKNFAGRFEIVEIDDMFGPTLEDSFDAEAIIASPSTKNSAEEVNLKRKEKGLRELEIVLLEPILAEDGRPISSGRIRDGEIDRDGRLYLSPQIKSPIFISDELRKELKKPWGVLSESIDPNEVSDKDNLIFAVGDETTKYLNSLSIAPRISVVDFKISRKKEFSDIKELGFSGEEKVIRASNPPGSITPELLNAVRKAISSKDKTVIFIDGEDDLAVLPLILASPLGSSIFYGQPGEGIVRIIVDEKIKAEIRKFVANSHTRGY